MKPIQMLAAVVLLISAAIGTYILGTDTVLWQDAPTHAYGLIAFTVIDIVLIAGLWWKPKLAFLGVALLALVQFGAMAADVFVGASVGTSASQAGLQHHLVTDAAFLSLLGVELVLILVGLGGFMMARKAPSATSPAPIVQTTTPAN